eukprot:jgi/Bigna1/69302/fgenesh1_pg.8_\
MGPKRWAPKKNSQTQDRKGGPAQMPQGVKNSSSTRGQQRESNATRNRGNRNRNAAKAPSQRRRRRGGPRQKPRQDAADNSPQLPPATGGGPQPVASSSSSSSTLAETSAAGPSFSSQHPSQKKIQFQGRVKGVFLESRVAAVESNSLGSILDSLRQLGLPEGCIKIVGPRQLVVYGVPAETGDGLLRSVLKDVESKIQSFESVPSYLQVVPILDPAARPLDALPKTVQYPHPRTGDPVIISAVRDADSGQPRVERVDLVVPDMMQQRGGVPQPFHPHLRSPALRAEELEMKLAKQHLPPQGGGGGGGGGLQNLQDMMQRATLNSARIEVAPIGRSAAPAAASAGRQRLHHQQQHQQQRQRQPREEMLSALSNAIRDFYQENAEREEDVTNRVKVFQRLDSIARTCFPGIQLLIFGSCAVGLSSRSSDIDLCLEFTDVRAEAELKEKIKQRWQQEQEEKKRKEREKKQEEEEGGEEEEKEEADEKGEGGLRNDDYKTHVLGTIAGKLEDSGFENVKPLLEIRIPIVKCTDIETQVETDISFTDAAQHKAKTQCLARFASAHVLVKVLIMAVKHWSGNRKIRSSWMLNSYGWCLLTIQFLQMCEPGILRLGGGSTDIRSTLGEKKGGELEEEEKQKLRHKYDNMLRGDGIAVLLHRFFMFYAKYDWDQNAVSVRLGRSVSTMARAHDVHSKLLQNEKGGEASSGEFPSLAAAILDNNSLGGGKNKKNKNKNKNKNKEAAAGENRNGGESQSSSKQQLGQLGFQEKQMTHICVEDPVDPTDNVGRNLRSYERTLIHMEFVRATSLMSDRKIMMMMMKSASSSSSSSSSSPSSVSLWEALCEKPKFVILQFLVPGSRMGAVIGTKGVNMEKIKNTTGVRMVASPKKAGIDWRYLRLDGIPERVSDAAAMVLRKIAIGRPPEVTVLIPSAHLEPVMKLVALPRNVTARVREGLPEKTSSNVSEHNHTVVLVGPSRALGRVLKLFIEALHAVGANEDGQYKFPIIPDDDDDDDGGGGGKEEEKKENDNDGNREEDVRNE